MSTAAAGAAGAWLPLAEALVRPAWFRAEKFSRRRRELRCFKCCSCKGKWRGSGGRGVGQRMGGGVWESVDVCLSHE